MQQIVAVMAKSESCRQYIKVFIQVTTLDLIKIWYRIYFSFSVRVQRFYALPLRRWSMVESTQRNQPILFWRSASRYGFSAIAFSFRSSASFCFHIGSRMCRCGFEGNCDLNCSTCNCDNNDPVWREDDGYDINLWEASIIEMKFYIFLNTGLHRYFTDVDTIPVTQLNFGDTEAINEKGYHTLGKLECQGRGCTIVQTNIDTVKARYLDVG